MKISSRAVLAILGISNCMSYFIVGGQNHQYEYPFLVNSNPQEVEKTIKKYDEYARNYFMAVTEKFKDAIDRMCCNELECEPERGICKTSQEDRAYLCKAILRTNYYGLEFVDSVDEDMFWDERKISLKRRHRGILATKKVPMYPCPKLQYVDLETDETVVLPRKYFVSGTGQPDSFLLYRRWGRGQNIYPHKFASGVNFDLLFKFRETQAIKENAERHIVQVMGVLPLTAPVPYMISDFVAFQELPVYEKFQKLFASMNVCGMPRAHQVALCRHVARSVGFEIEHRGYDESGCRKRVVHSNPPTDPAASAEPNFAASLSMIKCPPWYKPVDRRHKFHSKMAFLASHQQEHSVFMPQRLNLHQEHIRPSAFAHSVRLFALQKERRRGLDFLRPYYGKGKTLGSTDSKKPKPIPKKAVPAKDPSSVDFLRDLLEDGAIIRAPDPSVSFARALVEDETIMSVQRKKALSPFRRFQKNYASMNLNMRRSAEIIELCRTILRGKSYNLKFRLEMQGVVPVAHRSNVNIQLTMRDAEFLANWSAAGWLCPPEFETDWSYLLLGTASPDAVIVSVQYENWSHAIPDSYVRNLEIKREDRPMIRKIY